jgi:hypothetical protein
MFRGDIILNEHLFNFKTRRLTKFNNIRFATNIIRAPNYQKRFRGWGAPWEDEGGGDSATGDAPKHFIRRINSVKRPDVRRYIPRNFIFIA